MPDGLKRLHEVDGQIAESRERIIEQKRRIAELQKNGYNAAGSVALLREHECFLRLMTAQRKFIERTLKAHGNR